MTKKRRKATKTTRFVLIGLTFLCVIGAVTLWWPFAPNDAGRPSNAGEILVAAATLGDINAPVVIVEYSDFQCSACRYLATSIVPQLIETFVNTGKVRLEYRHFAHFGQESFWAGMAAECANEQDKFWEYHDLLFSVQGSPNSGVFSKAKLKSYAERIGMESASFNECLSSERYLNKVKADTQEAKNRGGTGTPTIFINDRKLGGIPPIELLSDLIQKELNR